MGNEQISKDFNEFVEILEESNFKKEEFLFNCVPYVNGLFEIIKKIDDTVSFKNLKVLDFGCGTGLTTYLLYKRGADVIGIDIYDKNEEIQQSFKDKGRISQENLWDNLKIGKKNLNYGFYEGKKIPYSHGSFGLVFAHAVIEHIPKEFLSNTLAEIYRVLKKGGYFVIARTPNKFSWKEFLTKSHKNKFSEKELLKLCNPDNYDCIYQKMTDFFPEVAPGGIQKILNNIFPLTNFCDKVINASFLKVFSHHHFLILKKR